MNTQLTELEDGILIDESHHTRYVVWGSAVERLIVAQEVAGSNPVTPPITAYRFMGERFTEPLRLRSYQLEVLRELRGQPLLIPLGSSAW